MNETTETNKINLLVHENREQSINKVSICFYSSTKKTTITTTQKKNKIIDRSHRYVGEWCNVIIIENTQRYAAD